MTDKPMITLFESLGCTICLGSEDNINIGVMCKYRVGNESNKLILYELNADFISLKLVKSPTVTFKSMTNRGSEADPVHNSGSDDEQLVDDSNSNTSNSVFVDVEHSISRSSLRSNNKRIENLSTNKLLPRTGDKDFTDFISIMFIAEKQQWKGKFASGATEEITDKFVRHTFSKLFITKCLNNSGTHVKVVRGAPKTRIIPGGNLQVTGIPVYQQLNRDTCVLSSAASAFRYFNDIQAHDIVKRNILSSVQQLDRFEFLEKMLKSRKLQYVVERKKNLIYLLTSVVIQQLLDCEERMAAVIMQLLLLVSSYLILMYHMHRSYH